MPAPERSSRLPAEERRALIEACATRLFAERGYASTSVEEIVGAARVTKPMLYRHFASKQELCVRLLERSRDDLIGAALQELGPTGSSTGGTDDDRVGRMIDGWLGWAEDHPHAVRLIFVTMRGDAEVERAQAAVHARQRATQAALIRELSPTTAPELVAPLAEVAWSAFAAMALWVTEEPGRHAAARHALVQTARGLLAGTSAATAEVR